MEKILVPVSPEVRLSHLNMLAQGMENVEQRQNGKFSIVAVVIGTTIVIALAVTWYFGTAQREVKEEDL